MISFGSERFGYKGVLEFDGSCNVVRVNYGQETPFACSGSLFLLFRFINTWLDREATNRIEPMEIDMTFYALGASCSADFHCWLADRYGYGTQNRIATTTEVMKTAALTLWEAKRTSWQYCTRAEMGSRGAFAMYCDREECSMGVGGCAAGGMFSMSTHNCFYPQQQLIFLAGLAALSDQYLDERGSNL